MTRLVVARPDGSTVEWTSRRHRKRLGLRPPGAERHPDSGRARPNPTSIWLATLFGVGSVCFALGSLPLFFDAVDPAVVGWTFFVGSLFFTSAAALQFHEAVTAPESLLAAPRQRLGKATHWRPRGIDWWATAIQLLGTVFFNVTTFASTRSGLSLDQEKHLIWTPDVAGSICFLLASWLAYAEVNRGVLPRPDRSVGWRISGLNLFGSIAFGASAIGARYLPTTGEPANIALVNLGTFVGAICFLAGAVLLPVESMRDAAPAKP